MASDAYLAELQQLLVQLAEVQAKIDAEQPRPQQAEQPRPQQAEQPRPQQTERSGPQ